MLEQTHAQTPVGGYIYHKARHGLGPLNANTNTGREGRVAERGAELCATQTTKRVEEREV